MAPGLQAFSRRQTRAWTTSLAVFSLSKRLCDRAFRLLQLDCLLPNRGFSVIKWHQFATVNMAAVPRHLQGSWRRCSMGARRPLSRKPLWLRWQEREAQVFDVPFFVCICRVKIFLTNIKFSSRKIFYYLLLLISFDSQVDTFYKNDF